MHYKTRSLILIIALVTIISLQIGIVSAQEIPTAEHVRTYSLPTPELDFIDFQKQENDPDLTTARIFWKNEANKYGYIVSEERSNQKTEIAILEIPEDSLSSGGEIILEDLKTGREYQIYIIAFDEEGNTSKELPISFEAKLPTCQKNPQGIDYVVPEELNSVTTEPTATTP